MLTNLIVEIIHFAVYTYSKSLGGVPKTDSVIYQLYLNKKGKMISIVQNTKVLEYKAQTTKMQFKGEVNTGILVQI